MDPKFSDAGLELQFDACPADDDDIADIPDAEATGQAESERVQVGLSHMHISDPNTVCTSFNIRQSVDICGPVTSPSAQPPDPYRHGPSMPGSSPPTQPAPRPLSLPLPQSEQQGGEGTQRVMNLFTPGMGQANFDVNKLVVEGDLNLVFNMGSIPQQFPRPPPPSQRPRTAPRGRRDEPGTMRYKFTEDELEREVEDQYLGMIARSCEEDTNWRRLARRMDMDQATLSQLDMSYGNNIQELVFQMLHTWKKLRGNPTVRELVDLLWQAKLAKQIEELFNNFRGLHEQQEFNTESSDMQWAVVPFRK